MGYTIGLPSLKLNNVGTKSKHCGDFKSVAEEALAERKGHDPDINPELTGQNLYEGYQTAAELMEYSAKHVATLKDSSGRGIRKDAVVMCATVIKPPAAMMNDLSPADQIRFLRDAEDEFARIVGKDNIKSTALHLDEQGAHLHIFWEPMTEDGRLCAKERHNLKFFREVNTRLPVYLREKGWDIENCQMYDQAAAERNDLEKASKSRRNGRSSAVYKRDMEREIDALERRKSAYTRDALAAKEEAEKAQKMAQRANFAQMSAIGELRQTRKDIAEAEDRLQLLTSYQEYKETAERANEQLDAVEPFIAEMISFIPFVKRAFLGKFLDRLGELYEKAIAVVKRDVALLKLYEQDKGISEKTVDYEPFSCEPERRTMALDDMVKDAEQQRQPQSVHRTQRADRQR